MTSLNSFELSHLLARLARYSHLAQFQQGDIYKLSPRKKKEKETASLLDNFVCY